MDMGNKMDNVMSLNSLADSNEGQTNGVSFDPSELFVTTDGECYQRTASTHQNDGSSSDGFMGVEKLGSITHQFRAGYWNVSGLEIRTRYDSLIEGTRLNPQEHSRVEIDNAMTSVELIEAER